MIRRALPRLALCLLALLAAVPALAVTKIEGEYQLMMELRKTFRAFPWDFDSNDYPTYTPAQIRIFSQPRAGIEAFLKVEADWSRDNNRSERPDFQYREAHMLFRRQWAERRKVELLLFSREDRFWVNNYLIPFVQGRGDAQGIRVDSLSLFGTQSTFIVADMSSQLDPQGELESYRGKTGFPPVLAPLDSLLGQRRQRTDDMYIVRLRRDLLKENRLGLGFTFNRYEGWTGRDSVSGPSQWVSVIGFDSRYRWGDTDLSLEYGQSMPQTGTDYPDPEISIFKKGTGIKLPAGSVVEAEVRSIRLGTEKLGYLNFAPGWWMRGPGWRNNLGFSDADVTGFVLETYYLLPQRAITYTNRLKASGNRVFSRNWNREMYNELYVEFINGFTGKTSYRRYEDYSIRSNRATREVYQSWFNEVQVESRLAYLRVQSKILNIGRSDRKELFVIEQRLNLTDRTKVYNRFAFGNDPSILRKGLFTQLQYRPTGNMEMFLQYGPDDIGGGSVPVDDGNLAGSGDQYDVLKFILKGNF